MEKQGETRMNNEYNEQELLAQHWTWLSNWLGGIIKDMQNEGYTEEQIIEELSKYGDVKFIERED